MSPSSPLFVLLTMVPVAATLLLGAQLRPEYFRQVTREPRVLMVGLTGQYLLLPLLALTFFYLYPASPSVRWGWFILAAVPGGAVSNMVTFLGHGRLSLSVLLTACSTLSGMITIPFWVKVGMSLLGDGVTQELPIARMVLGSFVILVVPLAIGITVGLWRPALAARLRRPTRLAMLVLLIVGGGAYVAQRWRFIAADFDAVTLAGAGAFHAVAVLGAWSIARGVGLDRSDSFTVGIEAGVQNVVVALLLVELLQRPELVPFIGYYSLMTMVLVFVWVALLGRVSRDVPAAADSRSTMSGAPV